MSTAGKLALLRHGRGLVLLLGCASFAQAQESRNDSTPLAELALRLIDENDLRASWDEIVGEFRKENQRYNPPGRLRRIARILDDPLALESVALEIRAGIEARTGTSGPASASELLSFCADVIDAEPGDAVPVLEPVKTGLPEDQLLFIEEHLDLAAELRASALAELDAEDLRLVYEVLPRLLDQFIVHIYLEEVGDEQALGDFTLALHALSQVDLGRLARAAEVLARLADPDLLKQIKLDLKGLRPPVAPVQAVQAEAAEAGFTGDIVFFKETRHGPIVIGGRGKTLYAGRAAFILDLGGHDTYHFAASTLDAERGLSVVIDLDGKDRYECSEPGSLAAALLGVSLLFDLKGDDIYEGTRRTQGFAGGGVALLFDETGKDRYQGEEYAQGAAIFGLGLLVDRDRQDSYSAYLYSQGFGLTRGLGLLCDCKGDDTYTATGKYPCTYGMEGVFQAASQGHGSGLRRMSNGRAPLYGGGIGLLMDGEGNDRYDAGNFSQGCGYFFGCGILTDRKGNDVIKGSRYSQGTGAHQAAGIVINDAGDDEYISSVAANQAGTWDITAGMFLDYAGDDVYTSQSLSQAGAAQTAFALLFDAQGNDSYQATGGSSQGGTGGYEYHDKPSLSLFVDLGGGKDSYTQKERKNDDILLEEWYGVFADLRGKDLKQVLGGKPGELKGRWGPKKK